MDLRAFPQFWRAGLDMACRLSPYPIRRFIDEALDDVGRNHGWLHASIDSRTHLLMPGMYPCIPGWHCDDFYRPDSAKGQPDLVNVAEKAPSVHYAMVLDVGTGSLTEFLTRPMVDPGYDACLFGRQPHDPATLYAKAHEWIEREKEPRRAVESGEVVRFDPLAFHRGMPATGQGWRHFVRLTLSNHYGPKDEVRTQTQVYLVDPFGGW
jgi:hypothetical protein